MSNLIFLLQKIKDGEKSFRPTSNSTEDMNEFQSVAKALLFANEEGLLDGFHFHKESHTGNHWYDLIMVKNGLSYKGEIHLDLHLNPPKEKPEEILELKPSFNGMSVDLKALWRRIRKKT